MATRGTRLATLLAVGVALVACQPGPTAGPSGGPSIGVTSGATAASTAAPTTAPASQGIATQIAARELPAVNATLTSGRYAWPAFLPRVTFDPGNLVWAVAGRTPTMIGLLRAGPAGGVVTVTLARVIGLHDGGADRSLMDGVAGFAIELENPASAAAPVSVLAIESSPDSVPLAPGRRIWAAFFDTASGLLVIMVEGSVSGWNGDLGAAEPLLESVTIGR